MNCPICSTPVERFETKEGGREIVIVRCPRCCARPVNYVALVREIFGIDTSDATATPNERNVRWLLDRLPRTLPAFMEAVAELWATFHAVTTVQRCMADREKAIATTDQALNALVVQLRSIVERGDRQ